MGLPSEAQAFEELLEHLRKATEAATKLGILRSDNRWIEVAMMFEATVKMVTGLAMKPTRKDN